MRLIDAEQFEVISWRAQGGREYANGFDDGVDYVVQKIDKAETVEAIPIEWLNERHRRSCEEADTDLMDAITVLCNEYHVWQKKQEAKNAAD